MSAEELLREAVVFEGVGTWLCRVDKPGGVIYVPLNSRYFPDVRPGQRARTEGGDIFEILSVNKNLNPVSRVLSLRVSLVAS